MEGNTYQLYTDGGSRGNPGKAASAAVILNTKGLLVDITGLYLGIATNNIAEYEALILGLKLAKKHKCEKIICYLDSLLVVQQIMGTYKINVPELKEKNKIVQSFRQGFTHFEIKHIERSKNYIADRLVNIILDNNN